MKSIKHLTPQEKRKLLAQIVGEKASATRTYPVSFAQQRLWFIDKLAPETSAYTISSTLQIMEKLNVLALHRCLDALVQRHESLRTNFVYQDGQPMQVIRPAFSVDAPIFDLRDIPATQRTDRALRLMEEQTRRSFDLTRDALLRITLISLSTKQHVLLVTMHHIISDAWSLGVLMREIITLYEAFNRSEVPSLPPLPIQYADFAVWQRNWLQGEVLQNHLRYWKTQLRGAMALELPTDFPRQSVQSYRGANHPFMLDTPLVEALLALGRKRETTLFMTLLAAFLVLLYRYSGESDLVVGTDVANRDRAETEALIGFFVNLLALRVNVSGTLQFQELLGQVRETVLNALAYQDIPFEMLAEHLRFERKGNQTPLIRVLFVMQNIPRPRSTPGKTTFGSFQREVTTAKFDLAFFLWQQEGQVHGTVNYSTDLYKADTVAALVERFQIVLRGIAARPDALIDNLEIDVDADKEQKLLLKVQHRNSSLQKLKFARGRSVDLP